MSGFEEGGGLNSRMGDMKVEWALDGIQLGGLFK
jgi:hypothetical protein